MWRATSYSCSDLLCYFMVFVVHLTQESSMKKHIDHDQTHVTDQTTLSSNVFDAPPATAPSCSIRLRGCDPMICSNNIWSIAMINHDNPNAHTHTANRFPNILDLFGALVRISTSPRRNGNVIYCRIVVNSPKTAIPF